MDATEECIYANLYGNDPRRGGQAGSNDASHLANGENPRLEARARLDTRKDMFDHRGANVAAESRRKIHSTA